MQQRPQLADVGRLLRRGVQGTVTAARAGERETVPGILSGHLGPQAATFDVVEETWPGYEHVNVQVGLDAWLSAASRTVRVVGVVGYQHRHLGIGDLLEQDRPQDPYVPRPGNVARVNLASGPDGQVTPCVRSALYLVEEPGLRLVVLVRGPQPESGLAGVSVQVTGGDARAVADAAREIRRLANEHNVFRHQVLSFGQEVFGAGETLLQFHARPEVGAERLVLSPDVVAAVHRQVVEVGRHRERLLRAGQHVKRGLLLHGPPGVGKTHTVRHLISSLPGTTVVQLTGDALHLIGEACSVARSLQPAMLVVEDVDLIAEDRGMHPGQHPLLFRLLDEMDGLAEDADIVFVLTTNRADLLEPALAARPGRIDQAVEILPPDLDGRRRLFELYSGSLVVDRSGLEDVLQRTAGVTASFIKELLRRAALHAAVRGAADAPLAVSATDLSAALDELLETRNAMTRVLLGGRYEAQASG